MNNLENQDENYSLFQQLEHDYIGYQSLTDVPRILNFQDDAKDFTVSNILIVMLATS